MSLISAILLIVGIVLAMGKFFAFLEDKHGVYDSRSKAKHAPHCFRYEEDPMDGPCTCGADEDDQK